MPCSIGAWTARNLFLGLSDVSYLLPYAGHRTLPLTLSHCIRANTCSPSSPRSLLHAAVRPGFIKKWAPMQALRLHAAPKSRQVPFSFLESLHFII